MKPVIILIGPTAVGKTEYALEIAKNINGEIISADSMQIYKYMDIGSAKPTKAELEVVKHYLVDEIDPRVPFSVADYQQLAFKYIKEVLDHGKIPIVSGGTGLYVNSLIYKMNFSALPSADDLRKKLEDQALVYGNEYLHDQLKKIDTATAERIHPNNVKKVIRALEVYYMSGEVVKDFSESFIKNTDYNYIVIGLIREREALYNRINQRVDILIKNGLVEEVQLLVSMGLNEADISMKGIGYKEIIDYLNGVYSLDEAITLIKRNTRRYAKRQITWFKRYTDIKWYHLSTSSFKEDMISDILTYIKFQSETQGGNFKNENNA